VLGRSLEDEIHEEIQDVQFSLQAIISFGGRRYNRRSSSNRSSIGGEQVIDSVLERLNRPVIVSAGSFGRHNTDHYDHGSICSKCSSLYLSAIEDRQ
jgi:arsenate reductase-like glutaredoxin family protein